MSLPSQPLAPDGGPDEVGPTEAPSPEVSPDPCPGPRWRPVVLVAAVGLLFAGADLVTWGKREPPGAEQSETLPLTLMMGERHELEVPGAVRIAVGSPEVMTVQREREDTLRLEPLSPGSTMLRVWKRDGTLRTWRVTVREP